MSRSISKNENLDIKKQKHAYKKTVIYMKMNPRTLSRYILEHYHLPLKYYNKINEVNNKTMDEIKLLQKIDPEEAVKAIEDYNNLNDKEGLKNIKFLAQNASSLDIKFFKYIVPFKAEGEIRNSLLDKSSKSRKVEVDVIFILGFIPYYCDTSLLVFSRKIILGFESMYQWHVPRFNDETINKIVQGVLLSIKLSKLKLNDVMLPSVYYSGHSYLQQHMRNIDQFYICNLIDNCFDIVRFQKNNIEIPEELLKKLPYDNGYMKSVYGITKFYALDPNMPKEKINGIVQNAANDIIKFYAKASSLRIPAKHKHDNAQHNYNIIWKDKLEVTPKEVEQRFIDEISNCLDIKLFKNYVNVVQMFKKSNLYFQSMNKVEMVLFEKLYNPARWFQPISAQMYKALISRSRAKYDGSRSYMVSRKSIEEIVFTILYNAHWLIAQSKVENDSAENKKFENILMQYASTSLKQYREACQDNSMYISIMKRIFKFMSAFGSDANPINETDNYYLLNQVFTMFYDNDDDYELIGNISKAIDLAHDRGPLAACFVEGGANTCKEVSNMPDDAFFEESEKEDIEDSVYLFESINAFKRMFSQKFWR